MLKKINFLFIIFLLTSIKPAVGQNNFKFMIGVGNVTPLTQIQNDSRQIDYVKDVPTINLMLHSGIYHRVMSDHWYAGVKGSLRHLKNYSHGEEFQLAQDVSNGTTSINYFYVNHSSISYGPTVKFILNSKLEFELTYFQTFHFNDEVNRRSYIGHNQSAINGRADGMYDFANSLLTLTVNYIATDHISVGLELGRYIKKYSLDRLFGIYTRYDICISLNYHI